MTDHSQRATHSGDLSKLAAECHRAKWQFDLNEENPPKANEARALVRAAFHVLHKIGDTAVKMRDAIQPPSSPQSDAPHVPAAFVNALAEEGTRDELVTWLQKLWNENCALRSPVESVDRSAINAAIGEINRDESDKFTQWEGRTYYSGFDLTDFAMRLLAQLRSPAASNTERQDG